MNGCLCCRTLHLTAAAGISLLPFQDARKASLAYSKYFLATPVAIEALLFWRGPAPRLSQSISPRPLVPLTYSVKDPYLRSARRVATWSARTRVPSPSQHIAALLRTTPRNTGQHARTMLTKYRPPCCPTGGCGVYGSLGRLERVETHWMAPELSMF